MIGLPRIQARLARVDDAPDEPSLVGKWTFEFRITLLGRGDDFRTLSGPIFETEEEARREMKRCAEDLMRDISRAIGADPNQYVDLKTNQLRSWNEH